MKLWVCHCPTSKFRGSARWCIKQRGDTIRTGTVSVLISVYCPIPRSARSRPSCLLRPRQGTANFSRSLQGRRPARVFFQLTTMRFSFVLPLRGYPTISQGWRPGHQLLVLISDPASVLTSHPRLQRRSRVEARGAPSHSPRG